MLTRVLLGLILQAMTPLSLSVQEQKHTDAGTCSSNHLNRMEAIERINTINEKTEQNRKKIQKSIADLRNGKITQEEYEDSYDDRAWPDFSSALQCARLIYTEDPTDKHAFMAMEYMLSYGPDGWDNETKQWDRSGKALRERQKIGEYLLEYHIDKEDLWNVAGNLGLPGIMAAPFLGKLYQKSPHKTVSMAAAISLAGRYAERTTKASISDRERKESVRLARKWVEVLQSQFAPSVPGAQKRVDSLLKQLAQVIGEPMANLQVKNLQGEMDQVANYRGKVVLIDLWATWCSPCKAAIPGLRQMNEELEGKPFQLISMSVDDDPQDVIDYIDKQQPMPWVNWYVGPDDTQIKALGITGYPTYFLLDTEGVLQAKSNYFGNDMRRALMQLIEDVN